MRAWSTDSKVHISTITTKHKRFTLSHMGKNRQVVPSQRTAWFPAPTPALSVAKADRHRSAGHRSRASTGCTSCPCCIQFTRPANRRAGIVTRLNSRPFATISPGLAGCSRPTTRRSTCLGALTTVLASNHTSQFALDSAQQPTIIAAVGARNSFATALHNRMDLALHRVCA